MVRVLVLRLKMGKISLDEIKEKYPQYYDDVIEALRWRKQ